MRIHQAVISLASCIINVASHVANLASTLLAFLIAFPLADTSMA